MAEAGVLWMAFEAIGRVTVRFPIIVSIIHYSFFLTAGHKLRDVVRHHVRLSLRPYVLDAVTTFQVLGCSLENGQMRQNYGYITYIITIFLLSSWYSTTLGSTSCNPCTHVVEYVLRTSVLHRVALGIIMQAFGAMLAYRVASIVWLLGLTDGHRGRSASCRSDLTVSLPAGAAMESLGCVFDFMLWSVTLSSVSSGKAARVLEVYVKCLMTSLLTAAGVAYTGMYMNPLNASNQTFGCDGTSIVGHLAVYWLCPLLSVSATAVLSSKFNQNSIDTKIEKIA